MIFLSQLLQSPPNFMFFRSPTKQKKKVKTSKQKIIKQTKNKKHTFQSKTKQNMESIFVGQLLLGAGSVLKCR